MRFIDRVEAEFEEPFADVLQGFADMGYGCDSTAAILGYDKSSFRRLIKRKGISVRWPDASQRIDTRMSFACPNAMIAARRAMAPRYTHPETGESMTATQWSKRLGISCTQFLRRYQAYGVSKRLFLPNQRREVR